MGLTWAQVNIKYGTNPLPALQGLSTTGPVALFDGNFTTLVVSPLDNFKSAVNFHRDKDPRSLIQMYNAGRNDHALCALGSQCFRANVGMTAAVVGLCQHP